MAGEKIFSDGENIFWIAKKIVSGSENIFCVSNNTFPMTKNMFFAVEKMLSSLNNILSEAEMILSSSENILSMAEKTARAPAEGIDTPQHVLRIEFLLILAVVVAKATEKVLCMFLVLMRLVVPSRTDSI